MKTSSPIAPRRIEVSLLELTSTTDDNLICFMDSVDENLAREVDAMKKSDPEVGSAAFTKQHHNDDKNTDRLQVLEPTTSTTTTATSTRQHSTHTSNASNLPPRSNKSLSSPGRRAMVNGGEQRSALTPRTDTQQLQANNGSPFRTTTMKDGIPLDPRRSTNKHLRSTPPRPGASGTSNINANNVVRPTRSFDQNRIPKPPRDAPRHTTTSLQSSPQRMVVPSSNSSARSVPTTLHNDLDPESQEQLLFEQRLCEDAYGVAVRKINQNGKAQLRYVKCVTLEEFDDSASTTSRSVSVASLVRSFSSKTKKRSNSEDTDKLLHSSATNRKFLTWGKKRDHKLALDKFVSVQTGKTTERTRKNPQPAARLLSLVTKDSGMSLDIEAPTRLDRDKFARAFARFLNVPLEFDDEVSGGDVGTCILLVLSVACFGFCL
jgi:hypothetical protein